MWKKPGKVSSIGSFQPSRTVATLPPEAILYLDAEDYSGSGSTWPADIGSNGTLVNSPTYTAPSPTYFSFNGTSSIAYTANLLSSFQSSNSVTLEIWVRTSTDNGVIISEQGNSPINSGYHLSIMEIDNGDLKVGLWNGTGISNTTVGAVTRDQWQHYVLTYDDNTNILTGYINATTSSTTTLENDPPVAEKYYALCVSDGTNMGDGSYLAADVGLFRVWNTALSAAQILNLYNENIDRFSLTPTTTSFTVVETTSWTAPSGVSRVQYLVVGGGGGAGNGYDNAGGGGGGGGMVLADYLDVVPGTSYTVTVGGGGAGGADQRVNNAGTPGDNSVFASITALGGGNGLGSRTGGTAGAAQVGSTTAPTGGSGSGGGNGGKGGGGAGGAGSINTGATGGAGGAGVSNSVTGSALTYGVGGSGGNAGVTTNGSNGTPNRGNGGRGGGATSSDSASGGNGGSGVVVIKYGN
jgi:hypothetical protein